MGGNLAPIEPGSKSLAITRNLLGCTSLRRIAGRDHIVELDARTGRSRGLGPIPGVETDSPISLSLDLIEPRQHLSAALTKMILSDPFAMTKAQRRDPVMRSG